MSHSKPTGVGLTGQWVAVIPLLVGMMGAMYSSPAVAQVREAPSPNYYMAFGPFQEGNYRMALALFTDEWRMGVKTTQSRWIDSICSLAMMGECHFQMGQFDEALDNYTSAIKLFLTFSDWMLRVQFPELRPLSVASYRGIPWGVSTRHTVPASIPRAMLISQGDVWSLQNTLTVGGPVQMAMMVRVGAPEIARCTAHAIRRRAELLGPLSKHDPLTKQLLTTVSRPLTTPNNWSGAWVDCWRGLALLAADKEQEAIPVLSRSLVAAGQFDHNLTSMALVELGRAQMRRGDYSSAGRSLVEASISAVYYGDYGIVEEALRLGSSAYLMLNRKGMYPPLAPALAWTAPRLRQLRVSLELSLAEHQAIAGLSREAQMRLEEAQGWMARQSMAAGYLGARMNFLRALVLYQQQRISLGDEAFSAAMGYLRHGSTWLFQIALVDQAMADRRMPALTTRAAATVYQELLRDPQPVDWNLNPMDSLAVLVTPHTASLGHWFQLAVERQEHDPDTAFEVAERIRRHRFFISLPFGGRLQALRWILEAPAGVLDPKAGVQRQDLLADFPAYAELSSRVGKLRAKLKDMPLVNQNGPAFQAQSKALKELAEVSAQQEVLLRQVALRRAPADLVFPPMRTLRQVQRSLPAGHALLSFIGVGNELHGFLMNNQKLRMWRVKGAASLAKRIGSLLREMGNHDANREIPLKELTDSSDAPWKRSSRQLLDDLLDGSGADFSKRFAELVIVPDHVLWYLPFEALEVSVDHRSYPLISRFRMRYAPTAALAVPDRRGRNPSAPTVVVLGRLYPRDDESVAPAAFASLAKAVPGAVALTRGALPAPSAVYSTLMERLIVLDDIPAPTAEQDPYLWPPIPGDRAKQGTTLADWLALPFGGPDLVILPGFHTAAENGLKRGGHPPGNDVFLSLCGLMSCGARTVLLSRWRTGGQTAFDLVREFTQEMPNSSAPEAWQRAVLVVADSRLNPEGEPRVKHAAVDELPKANHPFFWAGYLLADTGTVQREEAAPRETPDSEEKPRAQPGPGPQPKKRPADAARGGPKKPKHKPTE
jgi:tetratricopeptide (TPR) repeat protein